MGFRLTNNYAKNYCNWTLIVRVIAENIVTRFLGHSVDNKISQYVTVILYVLLCVRSSLSWIALKCTQIIKNVYPVNQL